MGNELIELIKEKFAIVFTFSQNHYKKPRDIRNLNFALQRNDKKNTFENKKVSFTCPL